MALTSNVIGDIGEMEVSTRLMETGLFIVFLLGGKVPAFDLLAEIVPDTNAQEKPWNGGTGTCSEWNGGTGTCSATIGVG